MPELGKICKVLLFHTSLLLRNTFSYLIDPILTRLIYSSFHIISGSIISIIQMLSQQTNISLKFSLLSFHSNCANSTWETSIDCILMGEMITYSYPCCNVNKQFFASFYVEVNTLAKENGKTKWRKLFPSVTSVIAARCKVCVIWLSLKVSQIKVTKIKPEFTKIKTESVCKEQYLKNVNSVVFYISFIYFGKKGFILFRFYRKSSTIFSESHQQRIKVFMV